MLRKKRHWDELMEDDPAAGLLNLFDVWIAFAAALLLATVSYYSKAGLAPEIGPEEQRQDRALPAHHRETNRQRRASRNRLPPGKR